MRLNPIVATLGTNALLYGAVFWYTGGIPRTTTARLARLGGGLLLGIPTPVYFAVVATAVVTAVVKLTPAGRRFEGVGANANAARTAGIRVKRHRTGAYVWAQILYCLAALLHAGIVNQPTSHEGDNYLLPSVAAVVLGGTSLLGGRGNLVATAVAALFLSQLDQFVLALGVTYATRTLVQAAALAVGVALYTVDWRAVVGRLSDAPPGQHRANLTQSVSTQGLDNHRRGREDTHDDPTRGGALLAFALLCGVVVLVVGGDVVREDVRRRRRGVARRRSRSV